MEVLLPLLSITILLVACLCGPGIHTVTGEELDATNLYTERDPVLSLEKSTYYSHLTNSDRSWLILFYLSWCGHCIEYVPLYLSVANTLRGWSNYVAVSAINCAQEQNRDICRNHNVTDYPTLMFLPSHTKDTTSGFLIDSKISSESDTLIKYAISRVQDRHPDAISRPYTPIPSNVQNRYSVDPRLAGQDSSALFYEDLVYALRYSLDREVGGQLFIKEESLQALSKYLYSLHVYFPDGNQDITDSIEKLYLTIAGLQVRRVSHKIWEQYLKESGLLRSTESHAKLVRCKGTESKFRGYPCSLWSLFHTLTVQAASTAAKDEKGKLKNVCYDAMTSIEGYVAHFFTCADCKVHFSKMATGIAKLHGKAESVCVNWLWDAHNQVNKRLAGEGSEDPNHPKIQFPSSQLCPLCRTPKGFWDEEVVYDYIHSLYTDIRHIDAPRLIPRQRLERLPGVVSAPHYSPRATISRVELSMCYIIYFLCALVIAGLFYFVVIRQRLYLRTRRCPKVTERHNSYHKPIY